MSPAPLSILLEDARSKRVLCLEYSEFARRTFAANIENWHRMPDLLSIYRQCQELLDSDVVCLPMLALVSRWWALENGDPGDLSPRPAGIFKAVFSDEDLLAYFQDVCAGIATVAGKQKSFALYCDDAADWYRWIGAEPDGGVAVEDVEDFAVCLANFLGRLSTTPVSGIILQRTSSPAEELAEAYQSVSNVCEHQDWAVAISHATGEPPEGFRYTAKRVRPPNGSQEPSHDAGWRGFAVCHVPEAFEATEALRAIDQLRNM